MDSVIKFKNVSKQFTINRRRNTSFQELLINLFHKKAKRETDEVTVLNNVSFEIKAGESVAFIGPNGTGKSTTLKLVSGILMPTSGQIEVRGRVGALLELGAGFHQDLTGRENIYLNGAVLGLSRQALNTKLDAIVAFSELERFIDMPVKHYSSGMYMRLGFSIAIHTDPAILLVDEVLSVGDAAFQRKCLDRIQMLKKQGVTIILVSHSLGDVRKVCSRAIWMEKGDIVADGLTAGVVEKYLWHTLDDRIDEANNNSGRESNGSGTIQIERLRFLDSDNKEKDTFKTGDTLTLEMQYIAFKKIETPVFGVGIHRSDGTHITGPNTRLAGYHIPFVKGRGIIRFTLSSLPLLHGTYYVSLSASDWHGTEMFDYHDQMYPFKIKGLNSEQYGVVSLAGNWSLEETT